jgi:hypothetical protein
VIRPDGSSRKTFVTIAGLTALLAAAAVGSFVLLLGPATRWSRAMAAAAARGRRPDLRDALASPALTAEQSYLLILPGRLRLRDRVVERLGIPPAVGDVIFDDELEGRGRPYIVDGLGRSPLPGDRRPCAVLRALGR